MKLVEELNEWNENLPAFVDGNVTDRMLLFIDSCDDYYLNVKIEETYHGDGCSKALENVLKLEKQYRDACLAERRRWTLSLQVNDLIDVYDSKFCDFYSAMIHSTTGDGNICVRFPNFGKTIVKMDLFRRSKGDEGYKKTYEQKRYTRFLPKYTVVAKPEPKVSKPKKERKPEPVKEYGDPTELVKGVTVVSAVSKSGRAVKVRQEHYENDLKRRQNSEKVKERASSRKKKKVDLDMDGDIGDAEDHNDWLCTICMNFQAPDFSELLLCDGGCLRSFHLGCLGFKREELSKGRWYCEECTNKVHTCAICGDRGPDDDVEGNGVFRCSVLKCGKYYHIKCLQQSNYQYRINEKITSKDDSDDISDTYTWSIRCPRHYCDVCDEFYKSKVDKTKAKITTFPCIRCPRSFHENCLPPGSRFNSNCLLCELHDEEALPSPETTFDTETVGSQSMQRLWESLHCCLPAKPPTTKKEAPEHFRLPTAFKEDVDAHCPEYVQLLKLDYNLLPNGEKSVPQHASEVACECEGICNENCLNRLLKIECCDKPKHLGGNICNVGTHCSNRQFKNKEYIKMQAFQEGGMGWGCRALQDVNKGTLVIEYIGEVIDLQEMQRRNEWQRKEAPHDRDFYIMELEGGYFVDGKHKGNLSRFINHSCDPNCELVRWEVRGRTRIGIFAKRNIASGESLSYDYQFETNEDEYFSCLCGSSNCRGTMAPDKSKKSLIDVEKLNARDKKKIIAQGRNIEKAREQSEREEALRLSLTSQWLPGDEKLHSIRNGPLRVNYPLARQTNVFLPRNVETGADFLARKEALLKRAIRKFHMRRRNGHLITGVSPSFSSKPRKARGRPKKL
jgi:hypothetical protein